MSRDDKIIHDLEKQWDLKGFLGRIRGGDFKADDSAILEQVLSEIDIEGDYINRRVVSLLWYIPIFMSWNRERIPDRGANLIEYDQLANKLHGLISKILGVP